jgi:hypothetical protein
MAEPLDAVLAIHNAFRLDMTRIDKAALDLARNKTEQITTVQRYRFLNEILLWHAQGEELAIFPAVDTVAPLISEPYERDHRGLDSLFDILSAAVSKNDIIVTSRTTAALKFHLDIHLEKEDRHLYRIMRERVPLPEQGKAVGLMSSTVPQNRFPEVVAWLYPLLDLNDRENMTLIWQSVMPGPVFDNVKLLIKKAVGNDWIDLTQRIPSLT